ncbi:MAG: zinc-binding dehydrogenase [Chloroflexi bacterium]|nr:zinc-binding dehydrogenase [Chloroflexota bacterium]
MQHTTTGSNGKSALCAGGDGGGVPSAEVGANPRAAVGIQHVDGEVADGGGTGAQRASATGKSRSASVADRALRDAATPGGSSAQRSWRAASGDPHAAARDEDRSRMRAVRLYGPGLPPCLERIPVPRPASGEALLRVLAAGVCHTELQLMDGTLNPGVWPLTPGHEIVGEVVEGPADLLGSRALVYYSRPCGECAFCLAGQEQVCPDAGPQPGLSTDGGFAELVRVAADCLVPLPAGLDPAEAAPLGCAAATALHALDGVAGVAAGETIVVYGVGGVGLALVQLGVLRGARVLAIGRSAAKLQLARELGAAEVVDAGAGDPVLTLARLTGGQGAHAVFELVGAQTTLLAGIDMLRRQGRLVLVGYGSARLRINPLKLVLRETRLLSSLGNTRAELVEVVRLAAEGALRVPIAGRYALEDAAAALAELRSGTVVGRAVVVPNLARGAQGPIASQTARPLSSLAPGGPPLPQQASQEASHEASRGASQVEERSQKASREASHGVEASRKASRGADETGGASRGAAESAAASREASHAPLPAVRSAAALPLEAELLEFVRRGVDAPRDDAKFSVLALRLFAYQFANNRAYRLLCERRGQTPQTVRHWREIPPVPIAAFKETVLAAEPIDGAAEFNSSGTTQPEHKSRHFHPSLRLYDLNARLNFKAHVLPDVEHMRCAVLFPHRSEMPNSSLAHWLTLMVDTFSGNAEVTVSDSSGDAAEATGTGDSWFVTLAGGLDADRLVAALDSAIAANLPVCLLAASFGLVHFLEHCEATGLRFQLPPGSRVMDTGGYKGRSREYSRDDLYALVTDGLGVPPSHIVNMYGMTEHGTQFLDNTLREAVAPALGGTSTRAADAARSRPVSRFKVVPPWARTLVVDPVTLEERPHGERGLLLHFDLVNRASVLAVLSEDVGRAVGDGFELFGRASAAEARGCSIALDELIEAVRNGEDRP